MERLVYRFALDAMKPGTQARVYAKRGDCCARAASVTVNNGAEPFDACASAAVLKAVKPDGTHVYHSADVAGGKVEFDLPSGLFAAAGVVECELCLMGTEGEALSTPRFEVFVEDVVYDDEGVETTDEYSALVELVGGFSDFAQSVELAETARTNAEVERASAESARDAAESGRVSAENEREAEETQRTQAETARTAAETLRETAEAGRVAAETERETAETGRADAENARMAAETGRATAENLRVAVEAVRCDYEAARIAAESNRVSAELARVQDEDDRLHNTADAISAANTAAERANTAALACESFVVTWDDVEEKPDVFPPDAHSHPQGEVTGLDTALAGKAASTHAHAQSDVTGLGTALADKSDVSHAHAYSAITGKPDVFPPDAHSHPQGEVTGLDTALAGKAASTHAHAQSDVTGLETALAGKSDVSHAHAYSAITGKPDTFAPSAHVHATVDVTGLNTALAGKANVVHTHSATELLAHTHAASDVIIPEVENEYSIYGEQTVQELAETCLWCVDDLYNTVWNYMAEAEHTHSTEDITGLDNTLSVMAQKALGTTATLTVAGWSNKTQTVSDVAGIAVDADRCHVITTPAPESFVAWCESMVRCTSQGAETLTFECETTPTVSLVVNVLTMQGFSV